MSDDLDDLKSALKAATPAPDAAKKAAHLALARKNFDDHQGSRDEARLMSDRHKRGLLTGVTKMLNALTSRGGLTATTALVAVAFVAFVPLNGTNFVPPWSDAPQEHRAQETAEMDDLIAQAPEHELAADQAASKSAPLASVAPAPSPSVVGRTATLLDAPLMESPIYEAANTESYANAEQNPLHVTLDSPVSTFSIDVDTASYAIVRNSLI